MTDTSPPPLVETIAECIDSRWLVKPVNGVLCLVEKLKERRNMRFEVNDLPASIAAIRVEKVNHLPGVREDRFRKICDYLLVARIDGQFHAVFIEMKATLREKEKEPKEQLVRSLPILEYLKSVCRVEYRCLDSALRATEHFWIIGEKGSGTLDTQGVTANPKRRMRQLSHKGANIATFVGPRMRFAELVDS